MSFRSKAELGRMNEKEALVFAIGREEAAHNIYLHASEQITNPGASRKLKALADEELKHKELLTAWLVSTEGESSLPEKPPSKIPEVTAANVLEVIKIAIKAETDAEEFYTVLAERSTDPRASEMFERIAGEEAKHREHLEHEYEMLKDSVGYWFTDTFQEPGYLERD